MQRGSPRARVLKLADSHQQPLSPELRLMMLAFVRKYWKRLGGTSCRMPNRSNHMFRELSDLAVDNRGQRLSQAVAGGDADG